MDEDIRVSFVVPNGCEEDECSEDMKQAFAACEQYRSGGLNTHWIREDDCMQLQNFSKKDVFVLEEFEGAVFEKLKSSKCLLVGPRCLSCCLMEGSPIPPGPDPVFTVAMRGLIVTASGLTKLQKEKVKERVHWMGGLYLNQLTKNTTHLVSSTVLSDKYMKSVALGIPIMNVTWITDVWDTSLRMNVSASSADFDKHRLKPFTNLFITTSGLEKHEKQSIIKLITENGGNFTGPFRGDTTDIVIMTRQGVGGPKHKAAVECGKACVHPSWVQHSVERGFAQPLANYKIAGASTSSPISQHNVPDMSLNFSRITGSRQTHNVNESTDTSVLASCQTKLLQEMKKSFESQPVDKDISAAFEKFDMNSIKKAGSIFDGYFMWVVGGTGVCRERACGVVTRAGGVRYDCPGSRVTHAVALSAAGASKAAIELPTVPVVNAIWLIRSVEAGKALDIAEYIMDDGPTSGSSTRASKSRGEPPSPLSKKNLQLLRPPCPPPPVFTDKIDNAQDDVIQQYKSHTSASTTKSDSSREAQRDTTEVTGAGEDEPTEEPEQIFEGVQFEVQSIDEETLCELGAEVTTMGGILVPAGTGGSHALVPLDFDTNDLANKNIEPVTVFWVRDCLTQQELIPIQYYHRPVKIINPVALKDVVLSLSTYSGVERAFLDELAASLGATTQLRFCRRTAADALASTHLLCPQPTGDKYAGAVRWGLPAVTARWLLDCAGAGQRLPEQPYLVGETKAPPPKQPEVSKESVLDKENSVVSEKKISTPKRVESHDSSKGVNPVVKNIEHVQEGADANAELSPASRYIAMARQGLLNADSQETPKRVKDVQQEQVTESSVRTPPLDEALSTPNLAGLSPTTRRRIQAVRRGEMPSDPIRTPNNPFEGGPGTPDSAFGAALRPGSGLSPGSRKRLWRQVQHLPGKQPSPATNKNTPLSEIRNRFLAQFAEGAPTPPTDQGAHGPRKLHLQDQVDTPPAKVPKLVDNQSPAPIVDGESRISENRGKEEDRSVGNTADDVDSQLRRLSAAMTGGSGTPAHLRMRRLRDSMDQPDRDAIVMAAGTETEELASQANTVHWDDGPQSQPPAGDKAPSAELEPPLPLKKFMVSNNVDNPQKLTEMIVALGGEVCEGSELNPAATHLLCAAPVRSEKMLGSVAAGKWVLHPAYVIKSRLHGAFLPEEEYEWGNPRAVKLPALSDMEQTVARAAHRWRRARAEGRPGAFAGLRPLLHMPPARRRLLTKLLTTGDAHVVEDAPPYSAEGLNICLADFSRYPISERDAQWLRDRRIPVCPYILIFSYLTDDEAPDPKKHCLPDFRIQE